jgi:histidinol-phosphate aminotransferase
VTHTAPRQLPIEIAPDPPTVAENIMRLVPYRPGKPIAEVERELGITGIVKLASNENSLGPSPRAILAMQAFAEKMHLYPDASSYYLRGAVAAHLAVGPETLVFGNGSDDIIHLLGLTFLETGDEVIQAWPSFVRYESAAVLNNAPCHRVPLTADWTHDLDAMAARVNANTRLIFLCNPNNPTGTIVGREALERFLDRVPERAIVVLDEAYYEYAAEAADYPDGLRYVREGRNVAVLRTFSKAYGLAGLRIGYGVMRPEIAEWLHRTREPFNVNLMAQTVAVAALTDTAHVERTLTMNAAGRRALYAAFHELGLPYAPTYANFVWVDVRQDCRVVFQALLRKGVITRTGDIFDAPTHLRVTIGTDAENAQFLDALRATLQN